MIFKSCLWKSTSNIEVIGNDLEGFSSQATDTTRNYYKSLNVNME
jgi:hypothetical protein